MKWKSVTLCSNHINMAKSIAAEIKFVDFCSVLDDISACNKHPLKCEKLEQFYKKYRDIGEHLKQEDPSADISFFPMLRLLLPQLERERPAYGLSVFSLRKILSKILGLSKESEMFKKLGSAHHDFPQLAYQLLKKQFIKSKNLRISEINNYLDLIARNTADANNARRQEDMVLKLLQETCPDEQKWILRIILKKMGLGIGETKMLNLFHPNAAILLNNSNSLLMVCSTLSDPSTTIDEVEITLFTPLRPMLSKRCDAKELFKSVTDNKVFIVETKFDGERFQLHMENNRFKYFSRRGYDFTKTYGESYDSGFYTPLLEGVFPSHVKSIILDGEMMGWNKNTKELGSKGMAFDVKHLVDTSLYQPCFCVFDILYLNGEILANRSLQKRIDILKDIFTPRTGIILHSVKAEAYTKQDVIQALNDSMDKKEEGIVYKDPASRYIPNDRNAGWWKVKLEYFSGVMSDLDVLILGGFYGTGDKIEGFIVGVSAPSAVNPNKTPRRYLSLAKITSGLSHEEWNTIRKRLDPHWVKTIGDNYESAGLCFGRMKPDVWIPPAKSCILLARATELMKLPRSNTDFKTNYTLRFPRIEAIRFDKPYHDCLTLTELDELSCTSEPVHKLYNKHLRLEDIEYEFKKMKKFKRRFVDTNVEVEEKVSTILKDHEFYVMSGTVEMKLEDVEKLIKENGGKVVKSEGENTHCILAGEKHIRFEYYKGSVDIVKLSWLQNVLDCRRIYPYSPQDTIYICKKTKHRFLRDYDKYGDSYTEPATRYSLEKVFSNIKAQGDYICPLPIEIEDLHKDMGFGRKLHLFDDYEVYFDKYEEIGNPLSNIIYDSKLDELVLKFWGGKVRNAITPNVNYIVTQSSDRKRWEEIQSKAVLDSAFQIIDKTFIYNQIISNTN